MQMSASFYGLGLAVLIGFLTAGSAAAAGELRFRDVDTDSDGALSRDEWRYGGERMFDNLDQNSDASLTQAEMSAGPRWSTDSGDAYGRGNRWRDRLGSRFSELDGNKDGVITPGEWRKNPQTYELLDTNRDGSLTEAEFANRDNILTGNEFKPAEPAASTETAKESSSSGGIEQILLQLLGGK
jgi:Ca2+-binding EF-hand superfamily protein